MNQSTLPPLVKLVKPSRLYRLTEQERDVLLELGRHEILDVNRLVYIFYGKVSDPILLDIYQASIRRTLRVLKNSHLVACNWYRPEGFKGKGKYPLAYWLLKPGYEWLLDHFPET